MPASKRPAPQDTVIARRTLLAGLARDADIFGIVSELAPLHPRNDTFPGEVFLRLGADALDRCGASRADPVALEGVADRFLPECTFGGRDKRKLRFAVLAAVAYIRAAADRTDVPVRQVCQELPSGDGAAIRQPDQVTER